MRLAEALINRADLQKRAAQLEERLVRNVQVQEGEEPAEDPHTLMLEFLEVTALLGELLPRIHQANLRATLRSGQTLTAALAHRDMLDLRLRVLRRAAAAASEKQVRYSNSELKMVSVIPARDLQKVADDLAKERRELEIEIQAANWATELDQSI